MKIFKRFTDGVFNPSNINNYTSDKRGFTVIYFFILVLLMIVPSTFTTILSPVVSYEDRASLRETFYHDATSIPFYIHSNILFNNDHDNSFVYKKVVGERTMLVIKANDDIETSTRYSTIIEFNRTGVFIQQFGIRRLLFGYNEYEELSSINFKDAYENDSKFWDNIFSVLDNEIPKQEVIYKGFNILVSFVSTALSLALWSLIFTIFNKSSNNKVTFSKYWQLMIYILTPYAVCYTLSRMFGFGILYYIGLIWTVINVMRFSQRIVIIKGDDNDEL